jgi:methionyl-tRNA formyltransferase
MRLVMMGTGTFAEPSFEALLTSPHQVVGLFTQPDRAVGQERGSTRQTGKGMKTIAQEKGVPVFQPESVNTPEAVARLQALQPDLLVVAAYGQILKPDVLASARHGGINVHASLLPKYRGAAPIAWAIYHGEKQTGVTIIQMAPQLDAGGMILQEAVDIGPEETAGELEARLAPLGAKLAFLAIEQIAAGTAKPIKQDQSQVSKAPKLKKEDGLIDWNRSAVEVCNQIRAMQPWPTAYTFRHGQTPAPTRIMITKVSLAIAMEPPQAPPSLPGRAWGFGQGSSKTPFLIVECGRPPGVVRIYELQPAGKRRMPVAEYLRGHPIKEGDRFGPETL